jgi:CrcB protein
MIAAGGGIGSVLCYLISGWGQHAAGGAFPLGTLIVNAAGCFVIGWLSAVFDRPTIIAEEYRAALLIGVLGGFTTFSTFALETLTLTNAGQFFRASLNVLASVAGALLAVWLGYRLAERLMGL